MSRAETRLAAITSHLEPTTAAATATTSKMATTTTSFFANTQLAPADPILGITLAFNADTDANKVNLGVGAFRTEEGKPYVLNAVRKVEQAIANDVSLNKEYLPIEGLAEFVRLSSALILGADAAAVKENRVAAAQTLSGTGALRVGAEFLRRQLPAGTAVYVSDPTWTNHFNIFGDAGFGAVRTYRYLDKKTGVSLDFAGMVDDLRAAPNGSVIVLHACAHNPTGVDPSLEQWEQLAALLKDKGHFVFFDSAYQGFATGDLERDAAAVRLFLKHDFECIVTQSYAKNMGLYGERIGCISVVCRSEPIAKAVLSQLKTVIRPMYSNPPLHGARLVSMILRDKQLFAEWYDEVRAMADRIKSMRALLVAELAKLGTPGDWSHITAQIGMFSYTGLSEPQVKIMIEKWHIHMMKNGRISMAGLNTKNVPHVAAAIKDAVTSVPAAAAAGGATATTA